MLFIGCCLTHGFVTGLRALLPTAMGVEVQSHSYDSHVHATGPFSACALTQARSTVSCIHLVLKQLWVGCQQFEGSSPIYGHFVPQWVQNQPHIEGLPLNEQIDHRADYFLNFDNQLVRSPPPVICPLTPAIH